MSGETTDQTPPHAVGFHLTTDEYPLTSGQLAARVGVSAQTVRNHAAKLAGEEGGGHARKDPERGWRFKPSAVAAWRHAVPSARKGGRRRGAGRKKTVGDRPLTKTAADMDAARRAVRERLTADADGELPAVDASVLMRIDHVVRCTTEELAVLAATGGPSRELMSDAQVRRHSELLANKERALKLAKEEGTLVPAAQVADAWSKEQARVRDQIQTLPKRIGPRVAAACWVGDELVADICRTLREHGVEGAVITRVADMLARPPALSGRVRELIEAEIVAVMRSIAEGAEGEARGKRQ